MSFPKLLRSVVIHHCLYVHVQLAASGANLTRFCVFDLLCYQATEFQYLCSKAAKTPNSILKLNFPNMSRSNADYFF